MKLIGYRTLKTGVGASVAMIIAQQLQLQYFVSAGIITILSIQSTKKQSIEIALQRILSCLLSLFISSIIFKLIGYNPIAFGAFILIFIPLTVRFNLEQGIIVNSVIVTHLLLEKSSSFFWIRNELALMTIGVGVALVLNMYMPSMENKIKEDQLYIEDNIKQILINMAEAFRTNYNLSEEGKLFKELEKRLNIARNRAYSNLNNYLLMDNSYYVKYMEMRMHQLESIKRMRQHFKHFFITYEQTEMIANYTEQVANSLYEKNTAAELLKELNSLRNEFKEMPLPSTREEFENRAMLFQFLNDMEQFLIIKYKFTAKDR